MRNNQFKRKIRQIIEETCKDNGLECLYVDVHKDSRTFYIYNSEWKILRTINIWMNSEGLHLTTSRNKNRVVALGNTEEDMRVSYMDFTRAVVELKKLLQLSE